MISMDKIYKRQDKADAVVKFTDGPPECPVGVITSNTLLAYGHDGFPIFYEEWQKKGLTPMRLVEVSPYDDFKIDEPVMVRDDERHTWKPAYFAGARDDEAQAFSEGATKWSSNTRSVGWNQCRRPTAEELAS